MASAQIPVCSALVICDGVYVEPATQKHTLLGLFDVMQASEVPVTCRFAVYFQLTEAMGECNLQLRIEHAEEMLEDGGDPIPPLNIKVNSNSPRATIGRSVMFAGKLPHFGVYHLELIASDGTPIQAKRFTVVQTRHPPTQGESNVPNPDNSQ